MSRSTVAGLLFLVFGLALPNLATATETQAGTVTYHAFANGEELTGRGKRVLVQMGGLSRLFERPLGIPIPAAPITLGYFDNTNRNTRETALFPDGSRCTVWTDFDSLAQLEITNEHEEILGFDCTKATTEIRSNRIEVWFTEDAGMTGSPSLRLVAPNALVLKFVQNGSSGWIAERFGSESGGAKDLSGQPTPFAPDQWGDKVDSAEYRARVTESYVTTVTVFENEQISFGNEIENPTDPSDAGTFHYSKGTVAVRRVVLPPVDDDTMVFAELIETSNGDAYDRTGSVFLIPTERERSFLDGLKNGTDALPVVTSNDAEYQGIVATEDYLPPLELIRFITPFGIGHFNEGSKVRGLEWDENAAYVMDVTALLPRLRGEVSIGVFIGNYDTGGHRVSLRLRYFPGSKLQRTTPPVRHWTAPLFNTVNALEMSGQNYGTLFEKDTLTVEFDLPKGVEDVQLRYLTTGHGGWGGGDEFNPKQNKILLDGKQIASFIPWRSDCGTFRELNPSSGNFWNGMSSSDFSRSGWCPGTTVSPVLIPLDGLAPGRHRISVAIEMGAKAGNSFSSWNVSGVLVGRFAEPATD